MKTERWERGPDGAEQPRRQHGPSPDREVMMAFENEKAVLRAALAALAGWFNSRERTKDWSVNDSAFCPGGRHASADLGTPRRMPEGLNWWNFNTIGEWREAIGSRLDALTGEEV